MSAIRILSIAAMALALGSCAIGPERIPRTCGVGYTWGNEMEAGAPLPACTLPGPKQVATACAFAAVGDDGIDGYVVPPSYEVSDLRCSFVRGDKSRARCSFAIRQLAGDSYEYVPDPKRPITPWRPAQASFTYRYFISGDETGHVSAGTFWRADAKCRPAGPKGELL